MKDTVQELTNKEADKYVDNIDLIKIETMLAWVRLINEVE